MCARKSYSQPTATAALTIEPASQSFHEQSKRPIHDALQDLKQRVQCRACLELCRKTSDEVKMDRTSAACLLMHLTSSHSHHSQMRAGIVEMKTSSDKRLDLQLEQCHILGRRCLVPLPRHDEHMPVYGPALAAQHALLDEDSGD